MDKRIFGFGLLASALGVLGCAGAGNEDPQAPAKGSSEARVVFEAKFSASGRFTVRESARGNLVVGIIGRSGEDDPAAVVGKLHPTSLVASYRKLLPGAEVPATLAGLEERFHKQVVAPSRSGGRVPDTKSLGSHRLPQQAGADLGEENFRNGFCRDFDTGATYQYFQECYYQRDLPEPESMCYYQGWEGNPDVFPTAYVKNDGSGVGWFWGPEDPYWSTGWWVSPGEWSYMRVRHAGNVCFNFWEGGGDVGLTAHIEEIKF